MPPDVLVNDVVLHPFLMAQDLVDSQRELLVLVHEHAEPRMRAIILARLGSYLTSSIHPCEYEELYSDAKTRLVTYLQELKEDLQARPCRDFHGYVAAIAHNVCHDYFRELYPARARLHKSIRDLLQVHPSFASWKSRDQNKGEWFCGFHHWRGQKSSSRSSSWLRRFYENPQSVTETLACGSDIQWMETDALLASIFNEIGEPITVTDVVNVVSDIRGVKDIPLASFDADGSSLSLRVSDSKLRVDSVLEMRGPLTRFWQGLCKLPRDQFRAYLLYARDNSGEDLISLFLAAAIATEAEIAALMGMTLDRFRDLRLNRLPLDNEGISKILGIKVERVYKLRFRAGKRLKLLLAEVITEKKWTM